MTGIERRWQRHIKSCLSLAIALAIASQAQASITWGSFMAGGSAGTINNPSTDVNPGNETTWTLGASGNANLSGGSTVNTLVGSDVAATMLTFDGLSVVNNAGQSFPNLNHNASVEEFSLAGANPLGRIRIETANGFQNGETLCFEWSWKVPMGSVNGVDLLSVGGATSATTPAGSTGSFRAALLFDDRAYYTPGGNGLILGDLDLTLGGYGIANHISGSYIDNFNDTSDIVGTSGSTLKFNGSQTYDGRFAGDTEFGIPGANPPLETMAPTAIDDDAANNGFFAGDDYGIMSMKYSVTLVGDLPAGANFVFTFDGVPVPEPASGGTMLIGLLSIMGMCIRRRLRS